MTDTIPTTTEPVLPDTRQEMEKVWSSYSGLTMHRRCPQAWQYRYVGHLHAIETPGEAVERDFGSWWHMLRAADSLARGRLHSSLQVVPKRLAAVDDSEPITDCWEVMPHDVLAKAATWWKGLDEDIRTLWVERLGAGVVDRLEYTNARWHEQWAAQIDAERPLAVELFWKRPLPGTDVYLLGYVDEVYADEDRGLVVVRDHKTAKALSTQTVADDMMDSQLQLYAWGASPIVTEWGGRKIGATAYDRVRSVAPRPPQLTLGGRLSVRNGEPSIGMADLHTYTQWARGDTGDGVYYPGTRGIEPGYYTAEPTIIERLSSPSAVSAWFQRSLTPLNTNMVKSHLRAAVASANVAEATRATAVATGEAPRNLTSACRWCDYVKLCRAQMVGGADGEYDLALHGLYSSET